MSAWRRFAANRLALVGLAMVAVVTVTAVLSPVIATDDPYRQDLAHALARPSARAWLGTDQLGRDIFSRLVYGSRTALLIALSSITLAVVVGVIAGSLAGFYGRRWDGVLMRLADVFFAFPFVIGAIVITLVVGRGVPAVILALAIFSWALPARLLRSSILVVRESDYVEAARSLGISRFAVLARHVLPNSLGPVLVYATVAVGGAVVAAAAVSFLGLGVGPGTPEWGAMVANGRQFFGYRNTLWIVPSLAVAWTSLGFVFVGDGLRDVLDMPDQ